MKITKYLQLCLIIAIITVTKFYTSNNIIRRINNKYNNDKQQYLLDPVHTQTKEKMNLVKYCRKRCGDLIVSVENDEDSRSDKGTATNKSH